MTFTFRHSTFCRNLQEYHRPTASISERSHSRYQHQDLYQIIAIATLCKFFFQFTEESDETEFSFFKVRRSTLMKEISPFDRMRIARLSDAVKRNR